VPSTRRERWALAVILALAAGLRLYGLNWDGGHWLHPDERMIYFVVGRLGWPQSWSQALSPESPLNPAFFAYGSFPIYLLRVVASALATFWPSLGAAGNLHLVGRSLGALFDLATVALTYRLACVLTSPTRQEAISAPVGRQRNIQWQPLLAALLVALAVLHVQNAHFYTVDPLVTALVMLVLNLSADLSQTRSGGRLVALGVALGLALASKISVAPLILVVPVALLLRRAQEGEALGSTLGATLQVWLVAGLVFILAQPYALLDSNTFVQDVLEQARIARGVDEPPYTLQYAGTLPLVYSIWQTAVWGLGLPVGLIAWAGFGASLLRWVRRGARSDALLLAWTLPQVAVLGLLSTRYLRYALPILPSLCIMAVWWVSNVRSLSGRRLAYIALILPALAYALLFTRLYAQPHTWLRASAWVYREVPRGSRLAVEEWDTHLPLPMKLDGQARRIAEYDVAILPLYAVPDDTPKWHSLAADLAASDYLIVASRRLYGSLPRRPDRYPVAAHYHDLLFAGELGFELQAEFIRGPAWLNPRLPPLPRPAPALFRPDESFVVYDHPRALILRNVERLAPAELLRRLAVDVEQ
jgi:hypothetical protein